MLSWNKCWCGIPAATHLSVCLSMMAHVEDAEVNTCYRTRLQSADHAEAEIERNQRNCSKEAVGC